MKHEKICGSTSDLAELIVEYDRKGKPKLLDIKGVPKDTIKNRVKAAWLDWLMVSMKWWGILFLSSLLVELGFNKIDITSNQIAFSFICALLISGILSLCHINEKFDKKWKKYFAIKTGNRQRNKSTFTDFTSKEFVIYNIDNVLVEFEATRDVSKHLKKVWIKKDPVGSLFENQANVKGLVWKDQGKKEPIWNAHFYFNKIPKSGKLYVEWI